MITGGVQQLFVQRTRIAPLDEHDRALASPQDPHAGPAQGRILPREGKRCTDIGFVRAGAMRSYLLDHGRDHTRQFLLKGVFVVHVGASRNGGAPNSICWVGHCPVPQSPSLSPHYVLVGSINKG
jgi:hypothetical protein